jgi:hypothetical protein
MYIVFFRHNAIAHLIDYSMVQTKPLYAPENQKVCVIRFIAVIWNKPALYIQGKPI